LRRAFVDTVSRLLEADDSVVLLLGDIGVFGFRHAAQRFPERVLNIGILEQSMVGVGAGLAMGGHTPILHTIAPFLVERALEQIKIDFAYQELAGNLVTVGASMDYSALGGTHHCPGDVGILLNVPETEIFIPGSSSEFSSLFENNYGNRQLSYFRLSEYPNLTSHSVEAGIAILVKEGTEALVIAVGPTLDLVLEASTGLDVSILYVTSLRPFDFEAVRRHSVSGRILIVEPYYEGTTAGLVLEAQRGRPSSVMSVGIPRRFLRNYGSFSEQLEHVGLTAENVRQQLQSLLCET
jgi:transketolase